MTSLTIGQMAPNATVYDGEAKAVELSALWNDRPLVVNFMRHFGCIHSRNFQSQLRQENGRIAEAGARNVAVFMGPPLGVAEFCAQRAMPFACFADPDHSAFRTYGLRSQKLPIHPNAFVKAVKLYARGLTTGLPHPGQDIRQLGGTFVIERGGRIRFVHASTDPSNTVTIATVLGVLGAS